MSATRYKVWKAILSDLDELDVPGEMILASDYDALAADYNRYSAHVGPQLVSLGDRIAELETALQTCRGALADIGLNENCDMSQLDK